MKPKNWLSFVGDFQQQDEKITFQGGVRTDGINPAGINVGNYISNLEYGGGVISATISFNSLAEGNAAGLILYYDVASHGFIQVQLGGSVLCSLNTFTYQRWTTYAAYGPISQLVSEHEYDLNVKAIGSRITVELDGIRILDYNLPSPLPKGQSGIWAIGQSNIEFSNFEIERAMPKIFVVMQFTDQFNELYTDVIQSNATKMGYEVVRADEQYGPGLIISDIEKQISESHVIIADITPKNPNVYWEVGYAHALRKPTILLAERGTQLPFDVSAFRVLFYDNTIAGKSRIESELKKHLTAISREWSA